MVGAGLSTTPGGCKQLYAAFVFCLICLFDNCLKLKPRTDPYPAANVAASLFILLLPSCPPCFACPISASIPDLRLRRRSSTSGSRAPARFFKFAGRCSPISRIPRFLRFLKFFWLQYPLSVLTELRVSEPNNRKSSVCPVFAKFSCSVNPTSGMACPSPLTG